MSASLKLAAGLAALLVAGCGEWSGVMLRNPETRLHAVCLKDWGRLPPEEVERLRQCIEICQAHGYELEDPGEMPLAASGVRPTRPLYVPLACRGRPDPR